MTEEERRQLQELIEFKKSLESETTIPFTVGEAFKIRVGQSVGITSSSKTASSENQAVNEGGSASYNVLKAPAGFVQVKVQGAIRYIPYYA